MIDVDLAELYGVPTHRLNERVKRNRKRFPEDFMFQLTKEEAESLRSQIAASKVGRGGRRTLPYVFTEQGVAMLSSVLNSERAIEVNHVRMNCPAAKWATDKNGTFVSEAILSSRFAGFNFPAEVTQSQQNYNLIFAH
jgi:hypothetical protein